MKKDNLKGILNPMSEREMKLVKGGDAITIESDCPTAESCIPDEGAAGASAKPCPDPPYRPCDGPSGTWVAGGLCCLVPCYGWFHNFGYAVLQGLSQCP